MSANNTESSPFLPALPDSSLYVLFVYILFLSAGPLVYLGGMIPSSYLQPGDFFYLTAEFQLFFLLIIFPLVSVRPFLPRNKSDSPHQNGLIRWREILYLTVLMSGITVPIMLIITAISGTETIRIFNVQGMVLFLFLSVAGMGEMCRIYGTRTVRGILYSILVLFSVFPPFLWGGMHQIRAQIYDSILLFSPFTAILTDHSAYGIEGWLFQILLFLTGSGLLFLLVYVPSRTGEEGT